jgi:cell wall-associated NlpC family hydrolase
VSRGGEIARRAQGLIGTRFRAQGRDQAFGLDCVGLAAAAAGVSVGAVRRDYRLRGERLADIEQGLREQNWRQVADGGSAPGDVLVCRAGPAQLHLAVATAGGFVHADARLRRVVERPAPLPWPVLSVWRAPTTGDEEEGRG